MQKWTGANKAYADKTIKGLTDWASNINPAAGAADAWNNNTFSVGLNDLQIADYNRNKELMNNAELNNIASGGNLDVNSNPYFQKRLDSKIKTMQEAFGSSLDSVRGGFQRGGMADSSMRQNKENQMLAQQGRTMDEFVNNAYDSEYEKRVQDMLRANSLLGQAGQAGYNFNNALQSSKDASLSNYAKMHALDANKQQMLMQLLNTISEPEQTTNSTTTTQRQLGFTDILGTFF